MKSDYIDMGNSFDTGTNFTLRGNATTFHHMYDYITKFGKPPQHHLNLRLGRTDAKVMYAHLNEGIEAVWPGNIVRRRIFDVNASEVVNNIDTVCDQGEMFYIPGSQSSVYLYRTRNHHIGIEIFAGNDEDYLSLEGIVRDVTMRFKKADEFKDKFFMISQEGNNLELMEYKVNKEQYQFFDIDVLYNADFKPVAERIELELSKKDGSTGIVLLHGVYGSGKTMYIRHLISAIQKRIIYMPADLAAQLGNPSFFNFIRGYPNSILIIEDCESILRKRTEGGNTAAITNILNMTAGIMGDALNIQVVCTFNASIDEIDEALLRPGRLIANHFFDFLTPDRTLALAKHLYGEDAIPKRKSMSLAEVYNMNDEPMNNEKKTSRGIGFTAGIG